MRNERAILPELFWDSTEPLSCIAVCKSVVLAGEDGFTFKVPDLLQQIGAVSFSDASLTQFHKCIYEVGEIVDSPSYKDQAKAHWLSMNVVSFFFKGRLYDKGMWGLGIFPHLFGIFGDWGFKYIGINALFLQKALLAIIVPQGADDFLKDIAKGAPEGRTLVYRQGDFFLCP